METRGLDKAAISKMAGVSLNSVYEWLKGRGPLHPKEMKLAIERRYGMGGRIRIRREAMGLSQGELAEKAKITDGDVLLLEQGSIPDEGGLVPLARALGITVMELVTGQPVKDLSGGDEKRRRGLKEAAQFSMTPAGQATVWQAVSIPAELERDGRLIRGIKALIDALCGLDSKEVEIVLGNLELVSRKARGLRKKNRQDR